MYMVIQVTEVFKSAAQSCFLLFWCFFSKLLFIHCSGFLGYGYKTGSKLLYPHYNSVHSYFSSLPKGIVRYFRNTMSYFILSPYIVCHGLFFNETGKIVNFCIFLLATALQGFKNSFDNMAREQWLYRAHNTILTHFFRSNFSGKKALWNIKFVFPGSFRLA